MSKPPKGPPKWIPSSPGLRRKIGSPFVPLPRPLENLKLRIAVPAYRFGERRSVTPVCRIICPSEEATTSRRLSPEPDDLLQLYQRIEDLTRRRERQPRACGFGIANDPSGCTDLVIARAIRHLVVTLRCPLSTVATDFCS